VAFPPPLGADDAAAEEVLAAAGDDCAADDDADAEPAEVAEDDAAFGELDEQAVITTAKLAATQAPLRVVRLIDPPGIGLRSGQAGIGPGRARRSGGLT
jgi:hypothetical protein